MRRNYPEYLLQERDRLRVLVKYQWITIALLTIVATWTIATNNIFLLGGSPNAAF